MILQFIRILTINFPLLHIVGVNNAMLVRARIQGQTNHGSALFLRILQRVTLLLCYPRICLLSLFLVCPYQFPWTVHNYVIGFWQPNSVTSIVVSQLLCQLVTYSNIIERLPECSSRRRVGQYGVPSRAILREVNTKVLLGILRDWERRSIRKIS